MSTLAENPAQIAGLTRNVIEAANPGALQFDGPRTAHCFGKRYEVLGAFGYTPEEAVSIHTGQMLDFCKNADQIAWRRATELVKETDFESDQICWKITSRLAVFP